MEVLIQVECPPHPFFGNEYKPLFDCLSVLLISNKSVVIHGCPRIMPDVNTVHSYEPKSKIPPRKRLAERAIEINRLTEELRRDVEIITEHQGYDDKFRGDPTELLSNFISLPVHLLRAADGHYGPLANRINSKHVWPPQMAIAHAKDSVFSFDNELVHPVSFKVVAVDGTYLQLKYKQHATQWWSDGAGNEGFTGFDIWKAEVCK